MPRTQPGETRRKVYLFVRQRILEGRPPSVREVAAAMGFSAVQTAAQHLQTLVGEGLLNKEPGRARGFRLPERRGRSAPTRLVPLVGQVQAGALTLALEEPEGYIAVQSQRNANDLFALHIRGLSMRDAGIQPGDIAIVRRQSDASSGDLVVAMVDEEATVKTLRRRGRRIELHPANPDFEPIIPNPNDIEILGKVVEIRRYLEGLEVFEEPDPA
ncbi:MAG: repressor LexA [Hyphomicrobiaceae bacterium]|jgi:repressor LexA